MRQGGVRQGEREEEGEGEETVEQLRGKVQQLQSYVMELTQYYSELMEAFEKLKGKQNETTVSFLHACVCFDAVWLGMWSTVRR